MRVAVQGRRVAVQGMHAPDSLNCERRDKAPLRVSGSPIRGHSTLTSVCVAPLRCSTIATCQYWHSYGDTQYFSTGLAMAIRNTSVLA
eukprot:223394-Rhodomonas_salina.6